MITKGDLVFVLGILFTGIGLGHLHNTALGWIILASIGVVLFTIGLILSGRHL